MGNPTVDARHGSTCEHSHVTLTYNHTKHAADPAYVALQAAIVDFLNSSGLEADYDERKVIINEIGAGLVYGEACPTCRETKDYRSRFPVLVVENSPTSVTCYYRCHVCGKPDRVAHYAPMDRPEREPEDQD